MKINDITTEAVKQRLDAKCWAGKHKEGTKIKGGVRVNNCVPNESVEEAANPAQQAAIAIAKKKKQGVAEGEKNPHTSALGKALYRDLSKEKKASPQQVEKNKARWAQRQADKEQGVAEGLPQTLRKVVPGYAKREIDRKMDAGKFGKTDADKDANFQRYKKIQDKLKEQGVAEGQEVDASVVIGKLYDIIDHAEDSIKNADFDRQVQYATTVRDRAVKALEMIKQGGNTPEAASAAFKYMQTGEQGVAEDFNGEYDDEAGMAQGNLYTIAQAAQGLLDTIDDRDNLPEWAQEKIAKVEGMLVTVWNYLQSQKAQGIDPQITESVCSLTEAEEIFNDFEQSVQARGLSEDIYDTITDEEIIAETAAWRRKEGKSKKGGLNAKGVASYRREHPGSKLQTAVTTKPSKLKKGSKAAKRRKSFCARMSGVKGPMKKPNGKPTRKALALRKWNC